MNIKKAELNRRMEVLSHFQMQEYVSDWARKRYKIEGRQLPFYRVVMRELGGQPTEMIQFPRFCLGDLMLYLGVTPSDLRYLIGVGTPKTAKGLVLPTRVINFVRRPDFVLSGLQRQVVDYVMNNHLGNPLERDRGRTSCIIALDTGVGKTFVAAYLIGMLGLRCLYVTLNRPLAAQAEADLSACFEPNNKPLISTQATDLTMIDVAEKPAITILNIDAAIRLSSSHMAGIEFMILDEVPALCTEERRAIFWLKPTYCIGLTAEPESRRDGLYQFAFKHLGAVVDETKYDPPDEVTQTFEVQLRENFVLLAKEKLIVKTNAHNVSSFLMTVNYALVQNLDYNQRVVELSMSLLARGRTHFIFAHHVDHIYGLSAMLKAQGVSQLRVLAAGADQHDEATGMPTVILATYSMGTVGISVVDATAMILAAPPYSTSYKQLFGRIKRLNKTRPEMNGVPREVWMLTTNSRVLQGAYEGTRRYLGGVNVPQTTSAWSS